MIISRTPFRISFFGGGTDYPSWYRQHGGAVLAGTINKYCYLTVRHLPPFFEHRTRVVYSVIERVQKPEEIVHPAAREIIRYLKIERGLEIHHDGDLPSRSGMGSSSAFTVGLLHALHGLKGEFTSKEQLARESIHLEQEVLRENVGSQDQVCAAYGGLNQIHFLTNGEVSVRPFTLNSDRLREFSGHLMLFYTGIVRTASNIAATFVHKLQDKEQGLRRLRAMVDEAAQLLASKADLRGFGELLHEAWLTKRSLSDKVTNPQVDALYEEARAAGAIGGKLLGAGGGGFMVLLVPPDRQEDVRRRLNRLIHVPFEFEFSGSQIIFFDPEQDYAEHDRRRAEQDIEAFREIE
jgi:D-glycero-alpha-D-manno-heptose-7-phosphate kinase